MSVLSFTVKSHRNEKTMKISSQFLVGCWILSASTAGAFTVPKNNHSGEQRLVTTTRLANQQSSSSDEDASGMSRRQLLSSVVASSLMVPAAFLAPAPASARLEAVNRPDLLPKEDGLNVIQTEKFLTSGQVKRLDQMLTSLERDTGFRVRVLCQAYPNTPGLAIRDYWDLGKDGQKDDKYVVLVVDQFGGKGNVLNFNVGEGVKLNLPNVFWTRLSGTYGTLFYVRENGIDYAITNAIEAIVSCLRSEDQYCVNVPEVAGSLKSLGFS